VLLEKLIATHLVLLNSKARYRTNKNALLNPIHGHWDPVYIHIMFLKWAFILFFWHLHQDFSSNLFPLGSSTKFCVSFCLFCVVISSQSQMLKSTSMLNIYFAWFCRLVKVCSVFHMRYTKQRWWNEICIYSVRLRKRCALLVWLRDVSWTIYCVWATSLLAVGYFPMSRV
jgi:hypothetical protein